MKNQKLIAYAILAICWEELLGHSKTWQPQQEPQFWMDAKNHTIAAIQNGPEYEAQPLYIIRENLLSWILEWLGESKIVVLYTCADNGEISIYDPDIAIQDGSLSDLEDPQFPELTAILYMAHD